MADQAAGVANSAGVNARLGIQHDAAGLDRTGGQHDRARLGFVMLPGESIEERDPARESVLVGEDLMHDGVGGQLEIGQTARLGDDDVEAAETRAYVAAVAASAAIGAGGPPVVGNAQDGGTLGQYRHTDLGRARLQKKFGAARLVGRSGVDSVGHVEVIGRLAADASEALGLVVPGCQVVVGDGPVLAEALHGFGLEIERPVAKAGASPGVGSPADGAQAGPVKLGIGAVLLLARVGVELTGVLVDLPEALVRAGLAFSSQRQSPRPGVVPEPLRRNSP